jgi:ABC-type uncharacterized transport system substrate-binding protein
MAINIPRRKLITLLGGGAAWPLAARAQQAPIPVIGYLSSASFETAAGRTLLHFKRGLAETGYVEDWNVTIEYRWADDQNERLPTPAGELVQRRVAVLVAAGSTTALPAKAATTVIPTVFMVASDPIELGLVTSLNRPAGNLTGVAYLTAAKEIGVLTGIRVERSERGAPGEFDWLDKVSAEDLRMAAAGKLDLVALRERYGQDDVPLRTRPLN